MTSRVFIVAHFHPLNYRNLKEFGALEFLYERDEIPPLFGDAIEDSIVDRLERKSFNYEVDFFAACGRMNLSHVALSCLIDAYGRVNCLLYNKETQQYHVKQLGGLEE